jgi:peptidoglycan hydrolase FlgJ
MSLPISNIGSAVNAVHDLEKAEYKKQKDRVTKATQEFEGVFIGMMLKQMRKSMAGENALFGNSSEAKVYQDMVDDKLAESMSHSGTFGLARAMARSMERALPSDPDAPLKVKTPGR